MKYNITLYYDFDTEYKISNYESVHIKKIHYPFDVILDSLKADMSLKDVYNDNYEKALMRAVIEYLADFSDYVSRGEE